MTGVLFVCHGNICRSPMAEAIFRHMLEQHGLSGEFLVDSAGVSGEKEGAPVDPEANAELLRRGIGRSGHVARQVRAEDYGRFDFILGMDRENYYQLKYLFGGDPHRKVGLVMGYTDRPREIEDPWCSGRFDRTCQELEEGLSAFLAELLQDRAVQGGKA